MMKLKKLAVLIFVPIMMTLFGCTAFVTKKDKNMPKLNIGSDIYPPYFFLDDNGQFTGIDVEIATEACKRLGIEPEFKQIIWSERDSYLADKTVDCLWGSFSMNGREDDYSWAGPYLRSKQVVVVNASSNIYTLPDLNGKTVSVQTGSKPEQIFLDEAIDGVSVKKVYSFPTMSNVFAALKKGYVDAAAGHETACRDYIKNISGEFRIIDELILSSKLGVAFEKGKNSETVKKLSDVLSQMRSDGTMRTILEKYDLDKEYALGEDEDNE